MSRKPLPEKPTLTDYQDFITALVEEKGWTKDRNELFVLFTEEVGELAKELRRAWKKGDDAVRDAAASEMADVFLYLANIASTFDIDLEKAVRDKIAFNDTRDTFGH